ncbi:MAG: bifunctional adenosylcobinamide kinase/adenosylcobinamide-phosphate guanylyltransferase [Bacteroidales bacterium]|uniref:bifunctional adenosylcobinamide kinase/adenosylcobinamide-phosphate guanylyltransferase n=1 Tax=Porphyromonas sp. TaxID=1924944 RepID=UPI0029724FA2|nr:bifunctional adenosylcobinamide kinase/adenosylcobinamide-phosphate guanylyltransferase [Porphyromonas sp.]MDD7438242.1 bifunctional adenosylcobinamide kinase/adenosylcobinamide-phosphate guanylyltransferase [Bacteroidales bacterium]MDY3067708.1 bifunctional adenosylcobinamide kinase/adenosylcobinamide-phosphate guanylyltransferase [Porphyromonas sp.]
MIILITGGARSGKSTEAEQRAIALSNHPIYLATAEARDGEMKDRIRRHQERRGDRWRTIEEPIHLGRLDCTGEVVLLDCLTLWTTNVFFMMEEDIDKSLAFIKEEFDRLVQHPATYVVVTNEVGMGGVSDNAMMRKYTDLQGWVNQHIARLADEVIFMVSGIPLKVK